jgi:hypothetical protein
MVILLLCFKSNHVWVEGNHEMEGFVVGQSLDTGLRWVERNLVELVVDNLVMAHLIRLEERKWQMVFQGNLAMDILVYLGIRWMGMGRRLGH